MSLSQWRNLRLILRTGLVRKTIDTTTADDSGATNITFVFLFYYPFYLFLSTLTSIFAGLRDMMHILIHEKFEPPVLIFIAS